MNQDNHQTSDHDLLIELRTEMRSLKEEIKKMNDGTAQTVADHETRIRRLEAWGSIAIGALYVVNAFIGYYIAFSK